MKFSRLFQGVEKRAIVLDWNLLEWELECGNFVDFLQFML